jgi:hypothetical protein
MIIKGKDSLLESFISYEEFYGSAKRTKGAFFFDKLDIKQAIEDGFISLNNKEQIKNSPGIIVKSSIKSFKKSEIGSFIFFSTDSVREAWKRVLNRCSSC